eukprot:9774677-Alexandrium_andersonii.AAC.1
MAAREVRFCPIRGSRSRQRGSSRARPSSLRLAPRRRNSSGAELAHRVGFRTSPPLLCAAPDGARIPNRHMCPTTLVTPDWDSSSTMEVSCHELAEA